MIVIYPPNHYLHNPKFELFDGEKIPAAESPERLEAISIALQQNGQLIQSFVKNVPTWLLRRIHERSYLQYIEFMSSNLGNKAEYPSVFTSTETRELEKSPKYLGHYSFDTYTPVNKFTFAAAIESAAVAFEGAFRLQKGESKVVYALCRPPGHHAETSRMGGYCYLNNAAIAAEYLSAFGKVTILDLDFHHGNGTQNIFYQRNDVFYVSIHADPVKNFPYYSGYEQEVGDRSGAGFNINKPLKLGTTDEQYQKALKEVLLKVNGFEPNFLVVSFGGDTYEKDPIGGFRLTLDYFERMGETIRQEIKVPILIIQEGGYNIEDLGQLVVNFLNGLTKEI